MNEAVVLVDRPVLPGQLRQSGSIEGWRSLR